jgi:hypothetical protein
MVVQAAIICPLRWTLEEAEVSAYGRFSKWRFSKWRLSTWKVQHGRLSMEG